jgi:hypothetical protein
LEIGIEPGARRTKANAEDFRVICVFSFGRLFAIFAFVWVRQKLTILGKDLKLNLEPIPPQSV